MNKETKKINLFWLASKGLMRLKSWFILKVFIISIWALTIINILIIYKTNPKMINNNIIIWYLFILINLVLSLFLNIITSFSLRVRQIEFGLYRCCGATRLELISLILNESLILTLFSLVSLILLEFFLLFYFKMEIMAFLMVQYNWEFLLLVIKTFSLTFLFIWIISFISYFHVAAYYAFRDPYNIIKY